MQDTVHVNSGSSSTESGQNRAEAASFDRPDAADPGIYCRGEGRQLLISTGSTPSTECSESSEEENTSSGDDGDESTAKRGEVRGRSEASGRRLRKRLHALRRDTPGIFITATLHETCPGPDRFKDFIEAFWKRIRRRYGNKNNDHVSGLSAAWVIESQKEKNKGVPHVHMIVYGVPFMNAQILSQMWHEVTDEQSDAHEKSGVDVEPSVNQDGKLQSYLLKYMTKSHGGWPGAEPGDPWAKPGRFWGFLGRQYLPVAGWENTVVKLRQHEALNLIEWLLDDWDVDIPDGVTPPSLIINCRGDPGERLLGLIDAVPER